MAQRLGEWTDKRTNSLRLVPNTLKTGELATIKIEGLARPSELLGKQCEVKLMEVDKDSRAPRVEVAAFTATIAKAGGGYTFSAVRRTDRGKTELPAPETLTCPDGRSYPFQTSWQRPHLKLQLDGSTEQHTVIVDVAERQAEGMVFELALDLKVAGSRKAHAFNEVTYLDCWDVLVHNCLEALKLFVDGHHALVDQDGVGTHFGRRSYYAHYKDEIAADHAKAFAFHKEMIAAARQRQHLSCDSAKLAHEVKDKLVSSGGEGASLALAPVAQRDFVLAVLAEGYKQSLASADWQAIERQEAQQLAKAMTDAGWEAIYFNPDTKNPEDWQEKSTSWQEHTWTAQQAAAGAGYYGAPLKDQLIDYRPNDCPYRRNAAVTPQGGDPGRVQALPFAVLLAQGGQHLALLRAGTICEVQDSAGPMHKRLFDTCRDFATTWNWCSGVILVPKNTY